MSNGILDKQELEFLTSEYILLLIKRESKSITNNEENRLSEIDEKLVQHNLRTTNNVMLDSGRILCSMPLDENFLSINTTDGGSQ